jgi:hypothetical protein
MFRPFYWAITRQKHSYVIGKVRYGRKFYVFYHAKCEGEASSIAYFYDCVLLFLPDDGG